MAASARPRRRTGGLSGRARNLAIRPCCTFSITICSVRLVAPPRWELDQTVPLALAPRHDDQGIAPVVVVVGVGTRLIVDRRRDPVFSWEQIEVLDRVGHCAIAFDPG